MSLTGFISTQWSYLRESVTHPQGNKLIDGVDKSTIPEAISYLSGHGYSTLQQQVTKILSNLPQDQAKITLCAVTKKAMESHNPKMLETCRNVMPLDTLRNLVDKQDRENAEETAQRYIDFGQDSNTKSVQSSEGLIDNVIAPTFGYLVKVADNIMSCILCAYRIDTDTRIRDSHQAQQQMMFLRSLATDIARISSLAYVWIKSAESSEALVKLVADFAATKLPKLAPYITDNTRLKAAKVTRIVLPLASALGAFAAYSLIRMRAKITPNYLPYFEFSINEQVKKGEISKPIPLFSKNDPQVVDPLDELIKALRIPNKAVLVIAPLGVEKQSSLKGSPIRSCMAKFRH